MLKRMFSTVFLWTLVFSVLYFFKACGGVALLTLASIGTQYELCKLLEKTGAKPAVMLGLVLGTLLLMNAWNVVGSYNITLSDVLLVSTVFLLFDTLRLKSLVCIKNRFLPTFLSIIYVPFMFCFPVIFVKQFSVIYGEIASMFMIVWVVAVSKFSDIGGMLVGCSIGKNLLIPEISPKKTYEGLIGGIIASVICGLCLWYFMRNFFPVRFGALSAVVVSIVLALVALAGDLLESAIKRFANEKDSGSIIPGIGGIFDLTDSLIFALPMGVYLINFYK